MSRKLLLLACIFFVGVGATSQGIVGGVVLDSEQKPIELAFVLVNSTGQSTSTDSAGRFQIKGVPAGKRELIVHRVGFVQLLFSVEVRDGATSDVRIVVESIGNLRVVEISAEQEVQQSWLRPIDPIFAAIYASKKTESIQLRSRNANLATNNARQIFNSIPGLNIWESDGAGLQLGIGGRGLSPNRTSNFNTRQNGYDISADALGYPESYYTPPAEAIERIQIVRGAASLQYGTQFGGMINFVLREGPDKPVEIVSRQTGGSWGLFNSFNSLGGTVGKLNYYGFVQYKRGDGWRPNSGFESFTGYTGLRYHFTENLDVKFEYTHMQYDAQQPGGLTDAQFEEDPRQSIRERNWFRVNWNLFALTTRYNLTQNTHFNVRLFGLHARREALGFLGQINRTDPGGDRDLISGKFQNIGAEARLVQRYALIDALPSTAIAGVRYYRGFSRARQGLASDGNGPDFEFIDPGDVSGSDYEFPSENIAVFAENMFLLTERLNVTPGLRFEYINTRAQGWYKNRNLHPLTGEVLFEETIAEDRSNSRQLLLFGIGAGYKLMKNVEMYANFSQNYRAINFTDMQINNPNFRIDPNMRDERGYNADVGLRGAISRWAVFDMSVFYLGYNDRIGLVQRADTALFNIYRLRTNVADSRSVGLESFVRFNLHPFFVSDSSGFKCSVFTNYAYINAEYLDSAEPAIDRSRVELVPQHTLKIGLDMTIGRFGVSYQYTYLSEQFTDATNAEFTSNAVNGLIPAYSVMDLSASYSYKLLRIEAGCNNLANSFYFTRRAAGYPGPGIIPSPGRSLYVTLQIKI